MPQNSPRFTFASGNARKILALPAYALGVLASFVVPRSRGRWVFGCGSGIGEGALALYKHAEVRLTNDPTTDTPRSLVWLARDVSEVETARQQGIAAVVTGTWRGFWTTLRSEVIVVTHGLGDVNRFATRGGFVVQLWHGIPFKRINLDSPRTTSNDFLPKSRLVRRALEWMHRTAAATISFMPAASELSASRLRTAFGLPANRVVVTGDPRDDVLSSGSAQERESLARSEVLSLLGWPDHGQRLVLYAPTWRDGEVDPSVPSANDWQRIAAWLENAHANLIVRPHPLGVGSYSAGLGERVAVLDSTLQSDITPVLPAIDTLITDYSSIAFDFALTGRPIVYLAADVAAYSLSRGLYEPYSAFSGGREVTSWSQVVELLEVAEADPDSRSELANHVDTIAQRVHSFRDGRNTERVYSEIISRLKER
ncbi:MAG: CDP-glycerol glycerophosphotransferase family protein [Microbacteriaceae bacterium]